VNCMRGRHGGGACAHQAECTHGASSNNLAGCPPGDWHEYVPTVTVPVVHRAGNVPVQCEHHSHRVLGNRLRRVGWHPDHLQAQVCRCL
jgi:hypothetical protein